MKRFLVKDAGRCELVNRMGGWVAAQMRLIEAFDHGTLVCHCLGSWDWIPLIPTLLTYMSVLRNVPKVSSTTRFR